MKERGRLYSIYMRPSLHEQVKQLAAEKGQSIAEFVSWALTKEVELRERLKKG